MSGSCTFIRQLGGQAHLQKSRLSSNNYRGRGQAKSVRRKRSVKNNKFHQLEFDSVHQERQRWQK